MNHHFLTCSVRRFEALAPLIKFYVMTFYEYLYTIHSVGQTKPELK